MTVVGAGGIRFDKLDATKQYERQYKKLDRQIKDRVQAAIRQLFQDPLPHGLRFEKLKGYKDPDVYTVHADGNFKVSIEIRRDLRNDGSTIVTAVLRKVGPHDEIDRSP